MKRFGRISRVGVTGSTNDDMARRLGERDTRGLTLVADYQERGTGRKGRAWIAPPGSALLCTIALPEPLPARDLWCVPFWTALTVRDALLDVGIEPELQWPNDMLLAGRKVAGILCISRVFGDEAWAGCGIGVNVQRPAESAAIAKVDPPPAFLSDCAVVGRDELLDAILHHAEMRCDDLADSCAVARAWESAAAIDGVRYRIAIDGEGEPFDAIARRLLAGGALLVECNGKPREVKLADARVLRT